VVLAAVAATAAIVIATRSGSKTKEPPVFLVLAHATVQVGSPDAVWIVNEGAHARSYQRWVQRPEHDAAYQR